MKKPEQRISQADLAWDKHSAIIVNLGELPVETLLGTSGAKPTRRSARIMRSEAARGRRAEVRAIKQHKKDAGRLVITSAGQEVPIPGKKYVPPLDSDPVEWFDDTTLTIGEPELDDDTVQPEADLVIDSERDVVPAIQPEQLADL
jgi:hypothetical protein